MMGIERAKGDQRVNEQSEKLSWLPLGDRIYLVMDEFVEKIGSIFVSETHSERSRTGTVKAVGEDVKSLKVGDRVLISFYTGIKLHTPETYSHEDLHRIVREGEVLMKAG